MIGRRKVNFLVAQNIENKRSHPQNIPTIRLTRKILIRSRLRGNKKPRAEVAGAVPIFFYFHSNNPAKTALPLFGKFYLSRDQVVGGEMRRAGS